MPLFIDPKWEFLEEDPEIMECVYLNHLVRSPLDLILDERLAFNSANGKDNQGLQFGHGDPNKTYTKLGPPKRSRRELKDEEGSKKPENNNHLNREANLKRGKTLQGHEIKSCLVCNKKFPIYETATNPQVQGFCSAKCLRQSRIDMVKMLYIEGVSMPVIARRIGVDIATALNYKKSIKDLPLRRVGGRRPSERPDLEGRLWW